jgi:hypothetical protein
MPHTNIASFPQSLSNGFLIRRFILTILLMCVTSFIHLYSIHAEEVAPAASSTTTQLPSLDELTVRIRKEISLEHKDLGLTAEESPLYYETLQLLLQIPASELKTAAEKHLRSRFPRYKDRPLPVSLPVFTDLYFHPEDYLGHAIQLRGHTQRILPVKVDPPIDGISQLYEIWLFTEDSQQNPAVIICQHLAPGIKPGDEIIDNLQVEGVFFKKYIYRAQDNFRHAPLILADRVDLVPVSYQPKSSRGMIIAIIVGFCLLFVITMYVIIRHGTSTRQERHAIDGLPPEKLEFMPTDDNENI